MWSLMGISYFEHDDGIRNMAKMLYEEKLIPIIGSGFTQGCSSHSSSVPNGEQTTAIMKGIISQFRKIDLTDADFNKTSDRFFSIVPKEKQWAFFQDYFTKVDIKGYRSEFLELPWPYIYTLNIDDGIENTRLYTPMLPYQNAKAPNKSMKILYKLHGDALHEVLYKVEKNIVFSVNQYIESLMSSNNKTFYNSITSEYKQKNLLFIGCSLLNEPDFKFVYSSAKEDISSNIFRGVVRTSRLSDEEELDLEEYGINTVIVVKDYELFYREFVREFVKLKAQNTTSIYQFTNPKHNDIGESKELTINYFSGHNIFNEAENTFYKSGMQITRTCIDNIEKRLAIDNSIIIRGRRFSGKSFLLSLLAERYTKYTVLYFPSKTLIDEDVLQAMFETNTDSIFLFDSNSLTDYAYHCVANSEKLLLRNRNKLVVAISSNDIYLADALKAEVINVSSIFNDEEIRAIEPLADKYGLIRRKPKVTNIDYLKQLSDEQKIDFPIFKKFPKQFSKEELVLLMLLTIEDKLYYGDINALNIRFRDVDILIERLSGIIEKVPTAKGEKSRHSTEKLVHNSKYYLLSIMRGLKHEEVVSTIKYIVSHLVADSTRKRLYIEAVLFDTLNQLFGYSKGAGELIITIYNSLETYLNQDMDYWLQRAKSIYRIRPQSYDDLINAYQYAKKSLGDGNPRLKAKSALTTSLICCLLAKLITDEKDKSNYEIEAIRCADEAINSEYFSYNRGNLKGELGIGKRRPYFQLIMDICSKYLDPLKDVQIAWQAAHIKKNLLEIHP